MRKINRLIIVCLSIIMLLSLIFVPSFASVTVNEAVNWIKGLVGVSRYGGRSLDIDGNGYWCTDLATIYINYLWLKANGDNRSPIGLYPYTTKNANQYDNYLNGNVNWTIISRTSSTTPKPGDLFVSEQDDNNKNVGHIGIIIEVYSNTSVKTIEMSGGKIPFISNRTLGTGKSLKAEHLIRFNYFTNPHTHSYNAHSVISPTCTTQGYSVYQCSCGASYNGNYTSALGHSYSSTVTKPTCTADGYTTYECTRCSYSYNADNTAKLGHKYGEWYVTKESKVGISGEKRRECKRCGYCDVYIIPARDDIKITRTDAFTVRISGFSKNCDIIRFALGTYATINEIKEKDAGSYVNLNGQNYVDIILDTAGKYTFAIRNSVDGFTDIVTYTIKNPFTDVNNASWYTNATLWCSYHSYITGTSATSFNPNGALTRAMLVQILSKVNGVNLSKINYIGKFTDVKPSEWYAKAVQWAVNCNITGGTSNNTFSPNSAVTREQLATFFFAYANYMKYDTSAFNKLRKYSDASKVSSWALNAVRWAVAEGLLSGTSDTTISPKTNATRAQAAVIFKSFVEHYISKQK